MFTLTGCHQTNGGKNIHDAWLARDASQNTTGRRRRNSASERAWTEVMPPKRKAKISAPLPAISPRKTRSATAVKRAETPAVAPARVRAPSKKAKLSTAGNAEETDGAKEKADLVKAKDDVSSAAEAPAAPPHAAATSVGAAKTIIIEAWWVFLLSNRFISSTKYPINASSSSFFFFPFPI